MVFVKKEEVDNWKRWYLSQGHTYPSTMTYYSFIKRYVGDEGIEITQKNVDHFRLSNMSCPCSGALKSFFYYLVRTNKSEDYILNIRFDRNKQTKRFPNSLTFIEVQKLIKNMCSLKTKILTIFIFELGLRLSEALKVKWEDFNWLEWISNKEDFGKVNLKNTKRGKFRVPPVKSELMQLLYNDTISSRKTQEGIPIGSVVFNFGIETYINRKDSNLEKNLYDYILYAENVYRKELYKVSLKVLGRRINPHILRHSKAQILIDNGMPIDSLKELLGHEKISSTEIYAQASPTKVKKDLLAYDIFKNTQLQKVNI
jgi:integrase